LNVSNVLQFEALLTHMSEHAKQKADEKIRLTQQIESLRHEQTLMFA